MIDFGLVALVVVQIALAGLCMWAFLSMKTELRAIGDLQTRIADVTKVATEAKQAVAQVETEHYKGLVRRVDGMEEELRAVKRRQDKLDDGHASLHGKYAALKRWTEKEEPAPAADASAVAPTADEEEEYFIPEPPAPTTVNGSRPSTFGKKV